MGHLVCAEFGSPRSVNPRTAATLLFDSRSVAVSLTSEVYMLKIVPDPPLHPHDHSLEDLFVQVSEYLVCALTVAQQTVLLHPQPPGQMMRTW
ncbi:hypothetical protein C6382_04100 [Pseudomonas sp. BBP2017]|nr:hypothetical protein C6382_04100 [Pseudomonas sp. BBP2017]